MKLLARIFNLLSYFQRKEKEIEVYANTTPDFKFDSASVVQVINK